VQQVATTRKQIPTQSLVAARYPDRRSLKRCQGNGSSNRDLQGMGRILSSDRIPNNKLETVFATAHAQYRCVGSTTGCRQPWVFEFCCNGRSTSYAYGTGSYYVETIEKTAWEDKTVPKAFWRGSLTGAFHNDRTNWRKSQRERLCYKVKEQDTQQDVMVDIGEGKVETRPYDIELLNDKYLDVAPVGGAVQVSH
jgi:hypothetical protein